MAFTEKKKLVYIPPLFKWRMITFIPLRTTSVLLGDVRRQMIDWDVWNISLHFLRTLSVVSRRSQEYFCLEKKTVSTKVLSSMLFFLIYSPTGQQRCEKKFALSSVAMALDLSRLVFYSSVRFFSYGMFSMSSSHRAWPRNAPLLNDVLISRSPMLSAGCRKYTSLRSLEERRLLNRPFPSVTAGRERVARISWPFPNGHTRTTPAWCIVTQFIGFFDSWCSALAVDRWTVVSEDFKYFTSGATAWFSPNDCRLFPHLQHSAIASARYRRRTSSCWARRERRSIDGGSRSFLLAWRDWREVSPRRDRWLRRDFLRLWRFQRSQHRCSLRLPRPSISTARRSTPDHRRNCAPFLLNPVRSIESAETRFSEQTLMFFTHGDIPQEAAAWTRGFGFFNRDHKSRTPSKRSIMLEGTREEVQGWTEWSETHVILSGSSAHWRRARHVFTSRAAFVPVRRLTNGAIPPALRIVVRLSASLAHSARAPTTFTNTSSGWLFNNWTRASMVWNSWNWTMFYEKRRLRPAIQISRDKGSLTSWEMEHFQIAPVTAARRGLSSVFCKRSCRGRSPRYFRTRSRISLSSAH